MLTLSGQISRNHLYDKLKVNRKKNATKRDPSALEYSQKKYPEKSCKKRSSSGSLHGCRQSSHVRKFPFVNAVPKFVVPFINDYYNVKAGGNCGYRLIAYFIYSDEEKWPTVRRDLLTEWSIEVICRYIRRGRSCTI